MNQKLKTIGLILKSYWWLGCLCYLMVSLVISDLAILGLASWQHVKPHQLDNTWLNFDFYWNMINLFLYMQFAFMGLVIYFLMKRVVKKKPSEVKP